jgi:hypothetical protein
MWSRTEPICVATDKWFQDFRSIQKEIKKHRLPDSEFVKVKVAIIDTGVNFEHPVIKEAKATGAIREEYCQGFPDDDSHKPKADDNGHGTFVASVLLKIAPDVELYIARAFNKAGTAVSKDDYKETAKVTKYTFSKFL